MSVTLQVVVLSVLIWAACGSLGFWSYYNRSMLWLGFTFHISKWAALIISSLFMVMNIWLAVRRVGVLLYTGFCPHERLYGDPNRILWQIMILSGLI